MLRVAALVVACLSFSAAPAWAQQEGALGASLRCLNCDDPELLAWLQPLDPEAERFTCALEVGLDIAADGRLADAYPLTEAPSLCEQRATQWALATRWEVATGAPVMANLPLEFEIQRTIKPRCIEACDPRRILEDLRRNAMRRPTRDPDQRPDYVRKGFRCETAVGLRIDTEGRVTATDVLGGDRNPMCLRVFRRWAESSRWSVAYKQGEPVVVWISQPIRIRTD